MPIAKDHVVSLHYRVSEGGQPIESSFERNEPLHVLIGHQNIIPGLEQALLGRDAGERFNITVPPEQAYGMRQDGMLVRVPKKYFAHAGQLRPGMMVPLALKDGGQEWVTVVKVGMTTVDVDRNPPMAGKTLDFEVEILAVREASAEEVTHRHAHGAGGGAHSHG